MTKIKLMVTALAAFVMINSSAAAQDVTYPYATQEFQPLTVKYLGSEGEYLLFKVVMLSPAKKVTTFSVDDKSVGELYSANLRTSYKEQILKIEKQSEQELNFKFVVGKNVYSKSFNINNVKNETTIAANL